jgi:hypothetical protein
MSPSNQSILQPELKLQEDLAAFKKNVDNMFLITMGIFVFCKFWHFLNLIGQSHFLFFKVYKVDLHFMNHHVSDPRMSSTSCFATTSIQVIINQPGKLY